MKLQVKVEKRTEVSHVITLIGSLDSNTYTELDKQVEKLLAESPKSVVFDMEQLDYISSAGVRIIFKTQKGMKELGGKLGFINLQPQIKKVFDIINALPSMRIFSSVKELDLYLDRMQKNMDE